MIDAYPITVGDVQVSWEQSDTLLKLPITFAYTYWNSETLDQGQVDENSNTRANSLLNTEGRVDQSIAGVRNAIGINSPTELAQFPNRSLTLNTDIDRLRSIVGLTSTLAFQTAVNIRASRLLT